MTCSIQRPDPQALFDRVKNQFSADVLGGAPVIPDSNEWYVVSNQYLANELWYSIADQQWKELDPRDACCDNLVSQAGRRGVYPRPATFARGYVKITGVPGSALSPTLSVQFNDQLYRIDAGAVVPERMPESGYVIVRLMAAEPGETGNALSAKSSTGKLISNLAGVDSDVLVYGSQFCGGKAAETCEEFRTRYLARLAKGHRSRVDQLVEDMLEFPCVTRVCRYACDCCPQRPRLDYFIFMDNTFEHGIPPAEIADEMSAWFFGTPAGSGSGVAGWGIEGEFHVARDVPVDVRITNLPCSSHQQIEDIRARLRSMFKGLCPGQQVCRRMIDAVVMQSLGFLCDFDVEIKPVGSTATFCEDFIPECDELPVAGTFYIQGVGTR